MQKLLLTLASVLLFAGSAFALCEYERNALAVCENRAECYRDTDCPNGYECNISNHCVEQRRECYRDSDCPSGNVCNSAGRCERDNSCQPQVICGECNHFNPCDMGSSGYKTCQVIACDGSVQRITQDCRRPCGSPPK